MSTVYGRLDALSSYRDNRSYSSMQEQNEKLRESKTLYVGNLSFYTTEEQIYELFSRAGPIRRLIMGLDRNSKTPCGFCFVEYYTHEDAAHSLQFISGTKLDERVIRADWDPGYKEGRQYGRGRSGGQVRDEYREDFDVGRGGWGHIKAREEAELYAEDHDAAGMRAIPAGENAENAGDDSAQRGGRAEEDNPRFRRERDDEDD